MIAKDNYDTQMQNRTNSIGENATSGNTNHLAPVNGSQVYLQTLERSIAVKVRSEVDNAVGNIETRVHDAIIGVKDSLKIHIMELAIKSVIVSSGRKVLYLILIREIYQGSPITYKWSLQVDLTQI